MTRNDLIAIASALLMTGSAALASQAPVVKTPTKASDAKLQLATVNDESVTAADLLKLFTDRHSGHAAFLGGESEARSFLKIVVDEKLLTQEAYNLALDEDESVAKVMREFTDDRISDELVRREIAEKAKPAQTDLEQTLKQLTVVLQVRQVALATRKEAEEVRSAVLAGNDVEMLARSCSGARTARTGGNTMVTWGQFEPEWEAVVFALEPGEVSRVIETLDGYEVVVCVNRVEIPVPELKEVQEKIEPTLLKRRTAELEKSLGNQLWTRYGAAFANIDLTPAGLYTAMNTDPKTVVATWTDGGKLTLEETFSRDEIYQLLSLPPQRAKNEIDKRIRATVNSPLTVMEARARKLDEIPEIAAKIDEYREYIMKNLLFRDHIFSGVAVKDEELQKYYDDHKTDFEEPPQYRLAQVMLASEQEAKDIYAKLGAGGDIAELANKYSRDPVTASTGGDLGWVPVDRIPPDFQEILSLKPGGVVKPVQARNGAWHVVQVTDFKAKRLPPLDEVREKVAAKALEAAKRDAREQWLLKLRAASTIEFDAAAIKQFVIDHQSDADAPPPKHAM